MDEFYEYIFTFSRFLKVKKWQPFAKCDQCISMRAKLLTSLNEAVLEETKVSQFKHRQQVGLGRKRFALREMMSVSYSSDFLHVSIDGMDNKKTNVPQQRSLTYNKSSASIGEPLKTRLMGAWNDGSSDRKNFDPLTVHMQACTRPEEVSLATGVIRSTSSRQV